MSRADRSRAWRPWALGLVCAACALWIQGDASPAQSQLRRCTSFQPSMCLREGYVESLCGRQHASECQRVIQQRFHGYYTSLPSSRNARLFRAECTTTPANVRPGKAVSYTPRQAINDSGGTSYAGRAHARRRRMGVNVRNARYAHSYRRWDQNGATVASCDEYVYEKYYDWSRFQDAVFACGDDSDCVYGIAARTDRPGLHRTIRDRANRPLAHQWTATRTGVHPKNAFYLTADFLEWNFPQLGSAPAFYNQLGSLRTEVRAGDEYYSIGDSGGSEHYSDVWAYAAAMHRETSSLSPAEREEILRRQRHLQQLIGRYRVAAARIQVERARSATGRIAAVSQLVQAQRSINLDGVVTQLSSGGLSRTNQLILTAPTAERGAVRQAITPTLLQVDSGALNQATTGTSTGLSAPRKPGPQQRVYRRSPVPTGTTTATAQPATATCRLPEYTCPDDEPSDSVHELAAKAFCRVSAFLANEWERKKAGQGGCFDRGRSDCDWNVDLFADFIRTWDPYVHEMEADYNYCKQWWPVVGRSSYPSVDAARSAMDGKRRELEEHLRDLPQLPTSDDGQRVIGSSVQGGERWGDLGSWSADYDYELLWELAAHEQTNADGSTSFCQLQGRTRGALSASITTPLDEDIDEITGGLANRWNELIDAEGWISVNRHPSTGLPDQKARAYGHLTIVGEQILAPTQREVSLSHALTESRSGDIDTPKASFDWMIGPIPVSVSAWAEFTYGGSFNATAGMPDASSCTALYEANANFTPTVGASGTVKVSAGIDGLLSIGIRGDVTLIEASVPIDVRAALEAGRYSPSDVSSGNLAHLDLVLNAGADVTLSTLGGRLRLTIDYLVDTYRETIFEWKGLGPYQLELVPPVEKRFPLMVFDI